MFSPQLPLSTSDRNQAIDCPLHPPPLQFPTLKEGVGEGGLSYLMKKMRILITVQKKKEKEEKI
jgi:hypothetical protein